MDLAWLDKTFGLITPYMHGRIPSVDTPDIFTKTKLSLPAATLHELLERQRYGGVEAVEKFSTETLRNFLDTEDDPLAENIPRKELINMVYEQIENEIQRGNIRPSDYPTWYLSYGIFVAENWESLSDEDFWKWAYCYGYEQGSREEAVKAIISGQNGMLREIMIHQPGNFEIRGVDIAWELIQSKYDPDYEEPPQMIFNPIPKPYNPVQVPGLLSTSPTRLPFIQIPTGLPSIQVPTSPIVTLPSRVMSVKVPFPTVQDFLKYFVPGKYVQLYIFGHFEINGNIKKITDLGVQRAWHGLDVDFTDGSSIRLIYDLNTHEVKWYDINTDKYHTVQFK